MPPRDIYNWDEEKNSETAPDKERASWAFSPGSAEDLEIEKKWLLLARIDPEKFSYFFDKYHDRIFAFAFWRTSDADMAADIANTVFTLAWQKLSQFRWQGYTFGAWLFQLARGEIANALRAQKTRREVMSRLETDELPDVESPEDLLAQKDDQEVAMMCLAKLDPTRHEVFVLHYWIGLKPVQIAAVLKIPGSTVRVQLMRGRKQLLDCLRKNESWLSPQWQTALKEGLLQDNNFKLINPDKSIGEDFGADIEGSNGGGE